MRKAPLDCSNRAYSEAGKSGSRSRDSIPAPKAMLWLRKGFGFAGAWTVREQNRLLGVCFGLQAVTKPENGAHPAPDAA